MTDIAQEMMNTIIAAESGGPIETVRDDAGNYSMRRVYDRAMALDQMQAAGPGDYRDIYAMSQQADAPITEAEVLGTQLGAAAGIPGAIVTGPPDVAALGYGGLKAATAEEGERLQSFLDGFSAISGAIGSEALGGLFDGLVDSLDVSDEAKQGLKQGYLAGEFASMGLVAPQAAKATAGAVADYAAGAPARLEDAKSGVTLGMNVDPTQIVDEAIVGAQKALQKPTKENPVTAVPPTETEPGIIAFHGSGADFDQFSLEKIGTGEGAQAYGYGLYFTDSEDIAKFYKDAITDPGGVPLMYKGKRLDTPWTDEIEERFADELSGLSEGEKDDFITVLANLSQINLKSDAPSLRESSINQGRQQRIFDKIIDDVEQPDLGEGKMYKVGLAPKREDMLDWNKFLSEQPKILDKIKDLPEIKTLKERGADLDKYPGFRIYQILQDSKGVPRKDKAASDQLASVGVEGIKYRAAGSRAANLDAADAEMNYVIFDDKAIKILEKYGIVGPVAITALGAAKQESTDNGA